MSNPLRRARNAPASGSHQTPSRMEAAQRKLKGEQRTEYTNGDVRGHLIAMSGEFVGTFLFLWHAFAATQIANNTTGADPLVKLLFISMSFGFSLATTAWVFYRVSGGLFNPAVTVGMMISQALPVVRGLLLIPTQLIGGIVAAALVSAMFPGTPSFATTLTPGTSIARGLFIEMFLTAELEITILFLAAEKQKATFVAPVAIGLALFVAELAGVAFTGGSLNPARSFGPCVATRNFPGYHWIYWLGPVMGSCLAAGYYKFAKFFNYETANPGQDDSHESETDDREK